jgi:DNA modification methylase
MKIRLADPETLKPYPHNPRLISQAAIDKVLASVREFGWRQPIVVDEDGVILVGHTRRLAALKGGYKAVPVHDAIGLSDAQKKAYRLADNRTGEESEWDMPVLATEIAGLRALDFDLKPLGFDTPELRALEAKEPGKDAEAVPEPPKAPVTRLGDLWQLGDHYVRCGDSTKAEDVAELLDGAKPGLMVTDPPYGVNYDPDWRNRSSIGWSPSRSTGLVENDDRADWQEAYALFPGDVAYVWHPAGAKQVEFYNSLVAVGFEIRMQIVWAKPHFPVGRGNYHVQHEPCWYAVRRGQKANWGGGRKQTTLWQIDNFSARGGSKAEGVDEKTGHGTQKPIECMKRPIENNSAPGDAVYDPFLGSGTTLIAAEMTGRRCYGMEISPAYCDVIVKRWQEFTGKTATLAESGQTFEQVAKQRKRKK